LNANHDNRDHWIDEALLEEPEKSFVPIQLGTKSSVFLTPDKMILKKTKEKPLLWRIHPYHAKRFRRMSELLRQSGHHVPKVFHIQSHRGCSYVVMEYIEGVPFNQMKAFDEAAFGELKREIVKLLKNRFYRHDLKFSNFIYASNRVFLIDLDYMLKGFPNRKIQLRMLKRLFRDMNRLTSKEHAAAYVSEIAEKLGIEAIDFEQVHP